MFKLEGLVAIGALEFAQSSRLVVADHVTLQAIDVGEVLLAHAARLQKPKMKNALKNRIDPFHFHFGRKFPHKS